MTLQIIIALVIIISLVGLFGGSKNITIENKLPKEDTKINWCNNHCYCMWSTKQVGHPLDVYSSAVRITTEDDFTHRKCCNCGHKIKYNPK